MTCNYLLTDPSGCDARPHWTLFLFLALAFFLCQHDLFASTYMNGFAIPTEEVLISAAAAGSLSHHVAIWALGVFAVTSLIRRKRIAWFRTSSLLGHALLFFVAWATLSLIWAEDSSQVLRRLVTFGIMCLAAAAVVRRLSSRQLVLWIFFTSGFFLLGGVSAEITLGTFKPFTSGFRFAGTLPPNAQGINCALLLVSGFAAADQVRRSMLCRTCALLGLIFLILTASRTAFYAGVLVLAVYFAATRLHWAKPALVLGFSLASCVVSLALWPAVVPALKDKVMLSRDASTVDSLSGRIDLWNDISRYIHQRPMCGYGYGGFWTPTHIKEVSDEEKWAVPDGHSAYLDFLLTLGVTGLAAYVLILAGSVRRAFLLHANSRNSAFAFYGAILLFCAVDGLFESAFIEPGFPMFICMIIVFQSTVTPVEIRHNSASYIPIRTALL